MALTKLQGQLVDSTTTITVNVDLSSKTDSIIVPAGTTAQRPETPVLGMLRYNTTLAYFETYTAAGWSSIATPPSVTSVTPITYNGESGTSFTINGSFFDSGATVKFITAQGTEYSAGTVSYINASQLTATTPQDFTVENEPLKIRVVNGSGLSYTLDNAIDCGGTPSWSVSAGSLGTFYDGTSFSVTVSAVDPDAGATVSYVITSGSLPAGLSFNTSTGVISGNLSIVESLTTSNFTIRATDNASNSTDRSFSITVTPSNYFGSGADGVGSY